jgi:hypothetical protein
LFKRKEKRRKKEGKKERKVPSTSTCMFNVLLLVIYIEAINFKLLV